MDENVEDDIPTAGTELPEPDSSYLSTSPANSEHQELSEPDSSHLSTGPVKSEHQELSEPDSSHLSTGPVKSEHQELPGDFSSYLSAGPITSERQEVLEVLQSNKNDPRVQQFISYYEANYEEFLLCVNSCLRMRTKVRGLKAQKNVSTGRSRAVEDIYSGHEDHIASLRRKINIVYHQLIEHQESEDALKAEIASLTKEMKDMDEQIRALGLGETGQSLRLAENIEAWNNEIRAEKNKVCRLIEHLRENFHNASDLQTSLENKIVNYEEKIIETEQEFIRVASNINKEKLKRTKIKAGLEAVNVQLKARAKDMEDLRSSVCKGNEECKMLADSARAKHIGIEKAKNDLKTVNSKIRAKKFEYDQETDFILEIENDIEAKSREYKRKMHEVNAVKDQTAVIEALCQSIKHKATSIGEKKYKVIDKKEKGRKLNITLYEEINDRKRKFEMAILEQTTYIKQRDFLRKKMMKEKNAMIKDKSMRSLHTLANKRLTQDNAQLVADGEDQKHITRKLEQEKIGYMRQSANTLRKNCKVVDFYKRFVETENTLLKLISGEELKMLESQNMYESTRSEHVILTRHILQLKDLLSKLDVKSKSLSYEAHKLVQERDFRDLAIAKETVALQKVQRQVFVVKVNLKDLKESNARNKLIIENQDLEEKKLIKMLRVMKAEKSREFKGLEWVIRDIDSLSLALTRRNQELHGLFKMVKLKQSLLEKGENMYNIRWNEHKAVTTELRHSKALRRLDRKRRNIVDYLLDTVKFLQHELEAVNLRNKGLQEELSHPRNIHRWRTLLGRDPETYQSIRSVRLLMRQIQEKDALIADSTVQIHQLDMDFIAHISIILKQPSPETVLQLKLYKEDLSERYVQLKRLATDLKDALEDKTDGYERCKVLKRKIGKVCEEWVKRMKNEKRRSEHARKKVFGPLPFLMGPKGKTVADELRTLSRPPLVEPPCKP